MYKYIYLKYILSMSIIINLYLNTLGNASNIGKQNYTWRCKTFKNNIIKIGDKRPSPILILLFLSF